MSHYSSCVLVVLQMVVFSIVHRRWCLCSGQRQFFSRHFNLRKTDCPHLRGQQCSWVLFTYRLLSAQHFEKSTSSEMLHCAISYIVKLQWLTGNILVTTPFCVFCLCLLINEGQAFWAKRFSNCHVHNSKVTFPFQQNGFQMAFRQLVKYSISVISEKVKNKRLVCQYMFLSVCIYNKAEVWIWFDTLDDTTSLLFPFQKRKLLIVFMSSNCFTVCLGPIVQHRSTCLSAYLS